MSAGYPQATAASCDNAGQCDAPRRLLEPGVSVPQSLSTAGLPNPDSDHVDPRGVPDGSGESHPVRELRCSGAHYLATSQALVSVLGRILGKCSTR